MMKTVFKYPLYVALGIGQTVSLPVSYEIVKVSMQGGDICFWAEHEYNQQKLDIQFQVFGTGHEIPDQARYIGTAFDGPFVWHVYTTNIT